MARPKGGERKKSNVIYLGEHRPPRNLAPVGEHRGKETAWEAVVNDLQNIAPVSDRMVEALKMPRFVYSHGPLSFSSNLINPLDDLVSSLAEKKALPSILPHYGLQVSSKGARSSCTFIDKKRRIIVQQPLAKENASWDQLLTGIERALAMVRNLENQGRTFHYVVLNSAGASSVI